MIDIIITGSSGFIGNSLVSYFKTQNKNILAITRNDFDLAKKKGWEGLPPSKYLINLASLNFVPDSWERKTEYILNNIQINQHALDWCVQCKANLINASGYVYGTPISIPINEKQKPKPNNPYALSKYLSELICEFYSKNYDINITSLRLFNVFGKNQNINFLIPIIINQLNNDMIIVENLLPRRDFVYIKDVVKAFDLSLNLKNGYNCINIGSGVSYSVEEVISSIQKIYNTNLPVFSNNKTRKHEIGNVVADISKAQDLINWYPKYNLEKGLKDMIEDKS